MANVGEYRDYREFLKDILEDRARKNKQYSLRAFARDIGLAPQNLSALFYKKKGISTGVAAKIATRLNLSESEAGYFCDLADLVHARSESSRRVAALRLNRYSSPSVFVSLREDTFQAISNWYYFAILEMTCINGFRKDPKWIAKRLRITPHQATQAIARLKRLKLLKESGGILRKVESNITTTHDVPSEAVQEYTRQLLHKAEDALLFQSVVERDCTTISMAIDPKRIPKAKAMVSDFRRALCAYLEQGDRTEIYCFAAQLFRLTNKEN